jgi:hypothetical protein
MMSRLKLVLAATAIAGAALGLAAPAAANPAGPCEELLYAGVCAPAGEPTSPPAQQSMGDIVLPPNTGTGIQGIN